MFLNRPRGDSHRTAAAVEQAVGGYYQEEGTERTCPNIARVLQEERRVKLTRQTVYNILRRRGVWVPPPHRGPPLIRFQMPVPNEPWQADLIALEETVLGKVFALVAIDDRSRFLTASCFSFTKDQVECSTPCCWLSARMGSLYAFSWSEGRSSTPNTRTHEGIQATPLSSYRPSRHRVQTELLWHIFAQEKRRKVYRDGTFSLWGKRYQLPAEYAADHA